MATDGDGWANNRLHGTDIISTFFHVESSYPFKFHPGNSFFISYSSPSNSLFATIGPFDVTFQVSSEAMIFLLPSVYSISSCANKRGRPNPSIPLPLTQKYRPLPRITPKALSPSCNKSVTSYVL